MKNHRSRQFVRLFIVLVILTQLVSTTSRADDTSNGKVWKSNPALDSKLAPSYTTVGKYSFRLPAGFLLGDVPSDVEQPSEAHGVVNHVYGTPNRDAVSSCILIFQVVTVPADAGAAPPLGDMAKLIAMGFTHSWQDLTISPVELGTISGVPFARCYYKGEATNAQGVVYDAHGFTYTTLQGNSMVSIISEAPEPSNETSLPVSEASAMTFKIAGNP